MKMGPRAFTLIELLVVIAVISILLSTLTPSLNRAKEAGKRAVCLQNTRTLAIATLNYCQDNDGFFPSCNSGQNAPTCKGWVSTVVYNGATIYPTPADPIEVQLKSLRHGSLYPYVETEGSYHCPVARSTETRTYSMFVSINVGSAWLGPNITKLNEIRNSGSRGLFIDDYMDNWDADWTIYYDQPRWWNPIPMRHGKGTVISCADGHAEWWDWKDSRTVDLARLSWADAESKRTTDLFYQPDNPDLAKAQRTTWGKLGYK
jgi:prepilin-type N-terminal cleavage/methylation domain-containing protein